MNGLKFNFRMIIVNILLLIIYFIITFLGEYAADDPIYSKGPNDKSYPLKWLKHGENAEKGEYVGFGK